MKNGFQKLKSELGGRISYAQLRDANARRQELSEETDSIYTRRLTFTRSGRRIEIFASQELGCVRVYGEFDMPFFTVNSQDRSGFTSFSIGKVRIGSLDYEVFTKDGVVTNSQDRILRSTELADLISVHPFRIGEALHFYRNVLVLYARLEDFSTVLVDRMVVLAEIIPVDNDAADLELPAQFADLTDTLKVWGISDDSQRSDKIEGTSEQELRQFLAFVEPRLRMINSYLSGSTENPVSNADANLAGIVETAMEVKIFLHRRSAQDN
jgi:hypothetical protein